MNDIAIYPSEFDFLEIEGIEFVCKTFIEILIDGDSISGLRAFESGVVFWPELVRSLDGCGKYLIFTCACGLAEDSGWELIDVQHSKNEVSWVFERNGDQVYTFEKSEYFKQIHNCEKLFNLSEYPLAIKRTLFPES